MTLVSDTTWLVTLVLAVARCGGLFVVAPVFAHAAVPVRVRLAVAVVMGLAVAGSLVGSVAAVPASGVGLLVLVAMEVGIGAAVGYLARLVFVGVELAAVHVAQQMGIALGAVFSPPDEPARGPVGQLLRLTAVVVFLAIGGHRLLIASLVGTFRALPPGAGAWPSVQPVLQAATAMLAMSFAMALKLAAPVLAALLATAVAAGLVQKTLPQLNILTVGLPLRVLVGLAVLAASLAILAPLLADGVDVMMRQLTMAFGTTV